MSLLSSLFGKKDVNSSKTPTNSETEVKILSSPQFHLKGKPDTNGLFPAELVMLAVAEKYKTSDTNFPSYLTNTYEIANPLKMIKNLQSRGLIEVGSSKESLMNYNVSELKEIATSMGLSAKGKKADIVLQLEDVSEEKLSEIVKDRSWKLTDRGQAALKANPYILYFLEKHPYNVTEVGVNIWTVNEDFVKYPNHPYRDIIYRQLNDQMNKSSVAIQTNPASGNAETYKYCECYRLMGLFVEEEGKSYSSASDLYFQYIYKRINIHAGLQLLNNCRLFKNDKKYQTDSIKRYYTDIQLLPFQKTELLRLIDEMDIVADALRENLITSFKRANDKGVMTEKEAADFIILELSGEVDKSRDLADKLAKKAVNKLI